MEYKFKEIHSEINIEKYLKLDGKDEFLSRAAINVLNNKRNGYSIFLNDRLFAVVDLTEGINIEFNKSIKIVDYLHFLEYLKSKGIDTFHIWDLNNLFTDRKLLLVDSVNLMQKNSSYYKNINIAKYEQFTNTEKLIKETFSDSFEVVSIKKLSHWYKELTNELWYSNENVYIYGDTKPMAICIERPRSNKISEIFLFGLTDYAKSTGVSSDLFAYACSQISRKHNTKKHFIQLWVHSDNKSALNLYKSHNFKTIKIRNKYSVTL